VDALFVDADDVGVAEREEDLGRRPGKGRGGVGAARRQELDGDGPVGVGRAGPEDGAAAAFADRFEQDVAR
jgi:hypothetical protein